jgi:hypothetical protein
MESAVAPNLGACSQSCGIIKGMSLAEDAGHLVVISDVTHSALLTVTNGFNFYFTFSSIM